MSSFIDCLIGYRSLTHLLLDNNKLGSAGAKSLALALPHMALQEMNVAFNEIDAEGVLALVDQLASSPTLHTLTLSGNVIDDKVAVHLANALSLTGQMMALYLDHTGLTSHAEESIAGGIARNRRGTLRILTGMDLGKALLRLGSPAQLAEMTNDQALRYLTQVWAFHEQQKSVKVVQPATSSVHTPTTVEQRSLQREQGPSGGSSPSSSSSYSSTGAATTHMPAPAQHHFRAGMTSSRGQGEAITSIHAPARVVSAAIQSALVSIICYFHALLLICVSSMSGGSERVGSTSFQPE